MNGQCADGARNQQNSHGTIPFNRELATTEACLSAHKPNPISIVGQFMITTKQYQCSRPGFLP